MSDFKGACFCGAVTLECAGAPFMMGYCHCRSCRSWSAGPVNAFTLWRPNQVSVTAGAEHVGIFAKTANSERQFCRLCGGHLMTNHPGGGFVDVYAATIPDLDFTAAIHVHYEETVLPIRDGLPKYKSSPGKDAALLPE